MRATLPRIVVPVVAVIVAITLWEVGLYQRSKTPGFQDSVVSSPTTAGDLLVAVNAPVAHLTIVFVEMRSWYQEKYGVGTLVRILDSKIVFLAGVAVFWCFATSEIEAKANNKKISPIWRIVKDLALIAFAFNMGAGLSVQRIDIVVAGFALWTITFFLVYTIDLAQLSLGVWRNRKRDRANLTL